MVGYKPKLCLIIIYIGYWSVVYSLQWNVESASKLVSKRDNTPMGPNGPCFKLIYHDNTLYEGWISSWFTLVHKGVARLHKEQ